MSYKNQVKKRLKKYTNSNNILHKGKKKSIQTISHKNHLEKHLTNKKKSSKLYLTKTDSKHVSHKLKTTCFSKNKLSNLYHTKKQIKQHVSKPKSNKISRKKKIHIEKKNVPQPPSAT